jgi:hypothetical protein
MKKQTLAYWLCLGGVAVSLTLLSIVRFDSAIANTIDTNKDKVMLALQARSKVEKPGGDEGDLKGGILLPESSIIQKNSPDDGSFVAQFTKKIDFQVQVWDPKVGTGDGDGIESVTFRISDENGVLVHENIERKAGYCPFGGGEPKCNRGKLAKNHKYRVDITVTPKNTSRRGASWFFQIQT